MATLLLVDDHRLFMEGLASLIQSQTDLEVKAMLSSGNEALSYLRKEKVDLALLDYQMPGMDGLELLGHIRRQHPETCCMLLSMHKSAALVEELMRNGGDGFVLKTADGDEFLQAIRKVLGGGKYFSSELMEELIRHRSAPAGNEAELTVREKEIVKEITLGLSTQEIADKLCISPRTVETHRKNLMEKLDVKNVAGLVRWAVQNGLGN